MTNQPKPQEGQVKGTQDISKKGGVSSNHPGGEQGTGQQNQPKEKNRQ